MSTKLSSAMIKALVRASQRERRNLCPMHVHAAAETALLDAMDRRGFVIWDYPEGFKYTAEGHVHHGAPRISPLGFAAIDA